MITRMSRVTAGDDALSEREVLNRPPVLLAVAVATATVLPAFLTGGLAVQIRDELEIGSAVLGLPFAAFFASALLALAGLGGLGETVRVPPGVGLPP